MAWLDAIREQFPTLHQQVNGYDLAYLDSAATMQKPISVINAIKDYYERDNANVHRGVHTLSQRATDLYEGSRQTIQKFINAAQSCEVIFTKGTTESINLVAQSFLRPILSAEDEILITAMEHHSNIVPWQLVAEQTGATLKVLPMDLNGELILDALDNYLTPRTKLFAFTHVSNALGTVNDIKTLIDKAHEKNIPVLIDGAQGIHHMSVDMQALDCDFYVFSAHKAYGPTGLGVLYGKKSLLNQMQPYQGGGDMISYVTFEKSEYQELPYKFEAGTPNIAGVIGFGKAIEFMNVVTLEKIHQHETALLKYAEEQLKTVEGLKIVGQAKEKAGAVSFVLESAHPHDIGTIMDQYGVAIRTGHHCAMPVMEFFNVPATARISFGVYNSEKDIDQAINGLHEVNKVFNR